MQEYCVTESRDRLLSECPDLRGKPLTEARDHVREVYEDALESFRYACRLESLLSEHERHVSGLRDALLQTVEPLYPRYTAYFRGTMEDLITEDSLSLVPHEVVRDVQRETKEPVRLTFEYAGETREVHTTHHEFGTPLLMILDQLGLPKTGVRYYVGDFETRNPSVLYLDGGQWSTSMGRVHGRHVTIRKV